MNFNHHHCYNENHQDKELNIWDRQNNQKIKSIWTTSANNKKGYVGQRPENKTFLVEKTTACYAHATELFQAPVKVATIAKGCNIVL